MAKKIIDDARDHRIDQDTVGGGYFRHAVYNHWDPYEDIPQATIEADLEKALEYDMDEDLFYTIQQYIALFGAGEESVTEDLSPLMLALDDINDQMFISSQIYDEAKHTEFFDRYWKEVLDPVAEHHGLEKRYPTEEHFFPDEYVEFFERTEDAMYNLLEDDTPETRVRAYCHYHLGVESVLAQTGYWGFTSVFSPRGSDEIAPDDQPDPPHLEGLVDGISYIRQDEGRHVGFGMQKVQKHLREDDVDEAVVHDTLSDLLPLIAQTVSAGEHLNTGPLVEYATEKLTRRIEVITDNEAEIPDVEELVKLDTAPAAAD